MFVYFFPAAVYWEPILPPSGESNNIKISIQSPTQKRSSKNEVIKIRNFLGKYIETESRLVTIWGSENWKQRIDSQGLHGFFLRWWKYSNLIIIKVAQLCEYSKNNSIVQLKVMKWKDCRVCGMLIRLLYKLKL